MKSYNVKLFHERLGHLSVGKLKQLNLFSSNSLIDFSCESCIFAKHHKLSFNTSHSRDPAAFNLLHIDLWGPYRTPANIGCRYFLTILDDHTRVTWTHLLQSNVQVPKPIKLYCDNTSARNIAENQIFQERTKHLKIDCHIIREYVDSQFLCISHIISHIISAFLAYVFNHFTATIRSDNGTEIIQQFCATLFHSKRIIHQRSIPGVPQQNGRIEKKRKYLLDTARALRLHANLPIVF